MFLFDITHEFWNQTNIKYYIRIISYNNIRNMKYSSSWLLFMTNYWICLCRIVKYAYTILYVSIYNFIYTIKYYSYTNIRYSIHNALLYKSKLNITNKNNTIKIFFFLFFIAFKLVNSYMVTFCMDSNYCSKYLKLQVFIKIYCERFGWWLIH